MVAPAAARASSGSRSARCLPMTSSTRNFDVAGSTSPTTRLTSMSARPSASRPRWRPDEHARLFPHVRELEPPSCRHLLRYQIPVAASAGASRIRAWCARLAEQLLDGGNASPGVGGQRGRDVEPATAGCRTISRLIRLAARRLLLLSLSSVFCFCILYSVSDHAPHHPHRHGRVLRVGRTARPARAARPPRRRRRPARSGAASWRRPATRRAAFGVRSAMSMARAVQLCPSLVDRAARLREVPGGVRAGLRALPRGHAAGRAAVARRGLSRRHRERVGRTARRQRREAAQGGHPRDAPA